MRYYNRTQTWYATYDDENQETETTVETTEVKEVKEVKEEPAKPKGKTPTFSSEQQAYVNTLVAEEKRRAKAKNDALILQLETLKNSSNTTTAEKEQLADRIESLKAEFQTKEVNDRKEVDKKLKQLESQLKTSQVSGEKWQRLFFQDRINNAIISAASAGPNPAHRTEQVAAILKPITRLEQAVGEDGKPIEDQWVEKVDFMGRDKDGNPARMVLTVTEAVKQMKEMPEEYGNLFVSGSTGGLGVNHFNGKGSNNGQPPKDMAAYAEWRKQPGNKIL